MRGIIILVAGTALLSASSPAVRAQSPDQAAAACNSYAAAAIPLEQVDPSLAIPACATALQSYPNSPALMYQLGRGYQKTNNLGPVVTLYKKAADLGYAPAQNSLGSLYLNGEGVPHDYTQALAWYRKAADKNYAGAQYNLGVAYANGQGVAQDQVQAAEWLRKAADQGFAPAQNNLAVMYENGLGVPRDREQALAWYRKAADQGLAEAWSNLAAAQAAAPPKFDANQVAALLDKRDPAPNPQPRKETSAPDQAPQPPIIRGGCRMDYCDWLRLKSKAIVQTSESGVLIKTLFERGELMHPNGTYDRQQPIKWAEPTESYAFCSKKLPAILFKGPEKGWVGHLLAPGHPEGGYGVFQGNYEEYFLICHGLANVELTDKSVASFGYPAELVEHVGQIEIATPSDIVKLSPRPEAQEFSPEQIAEELNKDEAKKPPKPGKYALAPTLITSPPAQPSQQQIASQFTAPSQGPIDNVFAAALANCDNQAAQQIAATGAQKAHNPNALLNPFLLLNDLATQRRREADQARRLDAIEQHRAQCHQYAEAAATQRTQQALKVDDAKQHGYQPISFEDFKLDGKHLAAAHAKLTMQGFYKKFGEIETLLPSGIAVAFAREYGNGSGVPLLSEDATRNVRKLFLQCGDNPAVPLGCPLTVVGHASVCTMTNLVGSKSVPCLAVEDGW